MNLRAAAFLDKDGTVLRNDPFNVDPTRMALLPRAAEGLRLIAARFSLVVVTNQPGVARGRFPESALQSVKTRLEEMFRHAGAALTAFYYCPHDPEGQIADYAQNCQCKKPRPGLIHRAARELAIDLASSWMIGDILDDVEAGQRAGCHTILIDNGGETQWHGGPWRTPEFVVTDLVEAAVVIQQQGGARP